jgi:hypothetical protein
MSVALASRKSLTMPNIVRANIVATIAKPTASVDLSKGGAACLQQKTYAWSHNHLFPSMQDCFGVFAPWADKGACVCFKECRREEGVNEGKEDRGGEKARWLHPGVHEAVIRKRRLKVYVWHQLHPIVRAFARLRCAPILLEVLRQRYTMTAILFLSCWKACTRT